jgi:hypothetical protein
MSDFTKEELCVIHLAIIRDMNQFALILKSSPSMLKIRDKLESMIDNFCDHESSEPILVLNKKCIKCNCHLETRPWGL